MLQWDAMAMVVMMHVATVLASRGWRRRWQGMATDTARAGGRPLGPGATVSAEALAVAAGLHRCQPPQGRSLRRDIGGSGRDGSR